MKSEDIGQINLFKDKSITDWWDDYWQDMPEYDQEPIEMTCYKLVVRFETLEDLTEFSNLIGQKVNHSGQNSIWFPKKIRRYSDKRYIDES